MFLVQEGDNRTRQPGEGREHHLKEDEMVEDASSIVADGFGSAHVQSGDDSFQLHHLQPGDTVCGIRVCELGSDSKAAACAAYLGFQVDQGDHTARVELVEAAVLRFV